VDRGIVIVVAIAVPSARAVIVVIVVAPVHRTGATRRRILFAVLGLPILGTGREVTGDFFDAVLTCCGAVDEISCPASTTAALNVCRLGHILWLSGAVPRGIAVLGHGGLYPQWVKNVLLSKALSCPVLSWGGRMPYLVRIRGVR